jgi:hypothetical protein
MLEHEVTLSSLPTLDRNKEIQGDSRNKKNFLSFLRRLAESVRDTKEDYFDLSYNHRIHEKNSVIVCNFHMFIVSLIGLASAGALMQCNHIPGQDTGGTGAASYSISDSYNTIFLATSLLATVSLVFSVMLTKEFPMQKVGGDAIASTEKN